MFTRGKKQRKRRKTSPARKEPTEELGFRIPIVSGLLELDSGFDSPGLRIPQEKHSRNFGFQRKNFWESRIRISLHGARCSFLVWFTYRWWAFSSSFVKVISDSINTVLQLEFGDPLIWSIPSLCCQTCYCGITTKIHLEPLIKIVF